MGRVGSENLLPAVQRISTELHLTRRSPAKSFKWPLKPAHQRRAGSVAPLPPFDVKQ